MPVIGHIPQCFLRFGDRFVTAQADVLEKMIFKIAQVPPLPCNHDQIMHM